MFRPTPALLKKVTRKLQLTAKNSPKDYYKGNRTGAMGQHTKHGGYRIDWTKVRTYMVPPDIDGEEASRLTPFVARRVDPVKGDFAGTQGPMDGAAALEAWKGKGDAF